MRCSLNHPLYNTPIKLRGISGLVTGRYRDCNVAARVISRLSNLSSADHESLASYHRNRALKLHAVWALVVQKAFMETFGRPYRVFDYKISGIARDEFAQKHKRVLRHCAHRAHEHEDVAHAHERLAKRLN